MYPVVGLLQGYPTNFVYIYCILFFDGFKYLIYRLFESFYKADTKNLQGHSLASS